MSSSSSSLHGKKVPYKSQITYLLNDETDEQSEIGGTRMDDFGGPMREGLSLARLPSISQNKSVKSAVGDAQTRRFPCTECNFRFRLKGDLQKHIKTVHLGIRNHVCRECGARFGERGNLTKHEKRHEGKKDFVCSVASCGKRFVLRDGLARHERCVHKINVKSSSSSSNGDNR